MLGFLDSRISTRKSHAKLSAAASIADLAWSPASQLLSAEGFAVSLCTGTLQIYKLVHGPEPSHCHRKPDATHSIYIIREQTDLSWCLLKFELRRL